MLHRLVNLFICLLVSSAELLAQNSLFTVPANNYQNTGNPLYWKNRKPHAAYWQQDVHYQIRAKVQTSQVDGKELADVEGSEILTYWNNSPDTLYEVFFHLYQNAFQPESYLHKLEQANKVKSSFGPYESKKQGTTVNSVAQGGSACQTQLDNTILKIKLNEPILPGSSAEFSISFRTYFDNGSMRRRMKIFEPAKGYLHIDGVHWYPRICVYDAKFRWETQQHLGKEFYGDYGTWDVELSFPNHYVVEATGNLLNSNEVYPGDLRQRLDIANFRNKPIGEAPSVVTAPDGTFKTWRYHAENVHDFAFTADPTYRIGETEWNGIKCVVVVQEPNAAGWQQTPKFLAEVVKVYSTDFGMFAYPKIVAADARDGMEYPMITLNGGNWPGHQYVIAHEVGHNWFFGMLGNNETYRAMLDEGFTQFLTAWSLKAISGRKEYPNSIDEGTVYMGYLSDAMNHNDAFLNTHSDDFSSALGHGGGYRHVYYKTATMLYNLQYVLGDELFLQAMKHYVNKWKICHPYPEDFRNAITEYAKTDLTWFFDQWMETTKVIDYGIEGKRKRKTSEPVSRYEITLKRKEEMQMPLDIQVTGNKGTQINYLIPNTWFVKNTKATVLPKWTGWGMLNKTYTFNADLPKGEKIRNIVIDPTQRLADIYRLDNFYRPNDKLSFDKGMAPVNDLTGYRMTWRPDIWWNSVDGVKAGVNWQGQYMNSRHISGVWLWANTGMGGTKTGNPTLDFWWFYKDRFAKNTWFEIENGLLDDVDYWTVTLRKSWAKNGVYFGFKSIYRLNPDEREGGSALESRSFMADQRLFDGTSSSLVDYTFWKTHQYNRSFQIGYTHQYNYFNGNGFIHLGARSAAPGSDVQYSYTFAEVKNNNSIGKSNLKTRVFLRTGFRGNTPEESMLYLAGASPEEMYDSKFTRSPGWIPADWAQMGTTTGHYQTGGGLNLRGYSGYQAFTADESGDTVKYFNAFRGHSGFSASAEWEFGNYIRLKPKFTRNWLKLDPYLFADAGWMVYSPNKNDSYITSTPRADAGIGLAASITRWGKRGGIKPLTIRCDLPFFLNTPPAGSEFIDFSRFVIGIGRSF